MHQSKTRQNALPHIWNHRMCHVLVRPTIWPIQTQIDVRGFRLAFYHLLKLVGHCSIGHEKRGHSPTGDLVDEWCNVWVESGFPVKRDCDVGRVHRLFEHLPRHVWIRFETSQEFPLCDNSFVQNQIGSIPDRLRLESFSGVETPTEDTAQVAEL